MASSPAGPWRRVLRRVARALSGSALSVVYAPRYALELPGVGHDARRGERILGFLAAEGLLGRAQVHRPEPMSFHDLRRVHSDDYLEALGRPGALLPILGFSPPDTLAEAFLDAQRWMAGGTLAALRLALTEEVPAINLGGGFHHAFRDRGERFCAFNDVAASLAALRVEGFAGKVLIVDLDLHDGDGTRTLLADDERVHCFSIHNQTTAPDTAHATTLELGAQVEDATYLDALRSRLPPVIASVRPDLAIYLCGSDPAADDAIGDWRISEEAMLARDRFVVEQLRAGLRPVPLAILLAGGYGRGAWRYGARFFAWLSTGNRIEPPGSEEALLARFRALAQELAPRELSAEEAHGGGDDDWGLTAEDLAPAPGTGLGRPTRFLGFYTRQGLELALERAGLLERLRARGFDRPTVEIDVGGDGGDVARLFGDAQRRELLMEVKARIDRRRLPEQPLLHLEWLLLQDPRAHFAPDRPGLPGQQHPGLGLLAEVMALLVAACDRLGLAGITFVPSYYHLAAKGRRLLRFLEPEDEGLVRSFEATLGGLPLAQATALVSDGKVVDARTGKPCTWRPMTMLLPVSEELAARFEDPAYEERAERAAAERPLKVIG